MIISPSVICADYLNLQHSLDIVSNSKKCKYLHIDVMDGSFVDQITIGESFLKWCKKGAPDLIMDVHLMIQSPEKHIHSIVNAGGDVITYHVEATENHTEILKKIKDFGKKSGIAIKPNTSIDSIAEIVEKNIDIIDNVLICTVEPGKYGQEFMPEMLLKVQKVKHLLQNVYRKNNVTIQVDGGVNFDNILDCKKSGADVFVIGSGIFLNKTTNINDAINKFDYILNN